MKLLNSRSADVLIDGVRVGSCTADSFVGEMTVARGAPAFANIVLDGVATVWRIGGTVLRDPAGRDPET